MKYTAEKIEGIIESGEPTFTLRAQDELSITMLEFYSSIYCLKYDLAKGDEDVEFLNEIAAIRHQFDIWQAGHKTKKPD